MNNSLIIKFDAPITLRNLTYFEIGAGADYFHKQQGIVSDLEKLKSMIAFLQKNPACRVNCYFTGAFLECLVVNSDLQQQVQRLIENGQIELLIGTYYDSISSLLSSYLFKQEVMKHRTKLLEMFDYVPTGFLNTSAIFSDDLLVHLKDLSIEYQIVPRVSWLKTEQQSFPAFQSVDPNIRLLLLGKTSSGDFQVQLLGDWDSDSLKKSKETSLASTLIRNKDYPSIYRIANVIIHGFQNQDMSYYFGSSKQKQLFKKLNSLIPAVEKSNDSELISTFMKLTSITHFDMIHDASNANYEYYLSMINCLTDFEFRL